MTRQRDRRRSRPSRPQEPRRSKHVRVLIVGEGRETERNYFDGLKREGFARTHFTVIVRRGKGGTRLEIAQHAVDEKNNSRETFDEVWCVMDVEGPEIHDEMRQALELLERNKIQPALSNPAIEVWFLAHFKKTGRVFLDGAAAKSQLGTHWRKHFHKDYDKADERIYQRLAPLTDPAIANAQWVRKHHHSDRAVINSNSSTDVDLLVGKLLGK